MGLVYVQIFSTKVEFGKIHIVKDGRKKITLCGERYSRPVKHAMVPKDRIPLDICQECELGNL